MSFENPLARGPVVLACAVGGAEGARAAAAALACAGVGADEAALFVDVEGRQARPTLLTSTAARGLEERLAAHLPSYHAVARGGVCHLAVPAGQEGLEVASAAATIMRGEPTVLHLPPASLQETLDHAALGATGVLLRADLAHDRSLVALLGRDLLGRGLDIGVLKRRLDWAAERRALFGALGRESRGALPERLVRRLGLLSRDREIRVQTIR